MRFIHDSDPEIIQQLEQIYKQSPSPRTRQRAQCLLLSHDGYSVPELAEIFRVHPVTIYHWLNAWKARQFDGLSDQTGFCLYPYLPYAWQETGKTIGLPSSRSPRLNAVGFFNIDNDFQAYTFECSIDSDLMIACIDEFCKQVTMPTVLVLDQASIHTSAAFTERLPDWTAQGVEIFYLPSYSPHLNRIEMLWRYIKYWWLDFDAYTSWKNLVYYVEDILRNIGAKYKINFV